MRERNFTGVEFVTKYQPPKTGEAWRLNVTESDLYFVLYAESSTLNAFYRVDRVGEMCGVAGACPVGVESCACRSDGTCNRDLRCNPQSLTCEACPVGEAGCACSFAYSCNQPNVRCRQWSLRDPGVCQPCALGTESCTPRSGNNSVAAQFWARCDEALVPFEVTGRGETCLPCSRGDPHCRCRPDLTCSQSEGEAVCDEASERCELVMPMTTPKPIAMSGNVQPTTGKSTDFVVEPVATRGEDPQPNEVDVDAAAALGASSTLALALALLQAMQR